ncbi:GDP-D-glucose phosphorylase 1-like [Paramacrobiotus metropolitanus]|uniref:GDP-D-glucose phosphorylase 1-like n=1 Tax=Paramacrobiotus metropolitanus TaxID=2943436 RepID=UPI002445FF13|nr:GDP-D-glucose phosphorylase 1-like [Paramacrobiotus metropolitanus]
MLSARDHYAKCWNFKLDINCRRYSLPDISDENAVENSSFTRFRKSSEDVLSKLLNGNGPVNDRPQLPPVVKQHIVMSENDIREFVYSAKDFVWMISYSDYVFNTEPPPSQFDLLLQSSWKIATDNNVFRYKLNTLETKVLPGKLGFVAQLNPQRALERRAPQPFYSMKDPFDPSRFNFTKIKKDEIFFSLNGNGVSKNQDETAGDRTTEEAKDFIIANVSPLEYCNILLVPKLHACRPQVVTVDALRLAMHTLLLSGTWRLRVGFNSLGAMASVNHLHCHAYYLKYNLPTESLPVEHLAGPCFVVRQYPASGFVFQFPPIVRKSESLLEELDVFISDMYKFICELHQQEIPHNIFITRGMPLDASVSRKQLVIRFYIWTREFCYGAKDSAAFNAALCELSGHLPVKSEKEFATLTEEEASKVLMEVSRETFLRAKPLAETMFCLV